MLGRIWGSKPPDDSFSHKGHKAVTANQEKLQKEFAAIFEQKSTPNKPITFAVIAKDLMTFLGKHCPEEAERLDKLIQEHEGYLEELAAGGWKDLKMSKKSHMGEMVNGDSMEKFRGDAVHAVGDICLSAMKKLGFDPPGKFSATGTPGWNSDIDTVFFPPEGMPEKIQVLGKLMFDGIFYGKFNTAPGKLFDTEAYLRQAAVGYNTEKWMETDEGKAGYASLELHAACFQMLMQHGSPDSAEWQEFKERTIIGATEELKVPLSEAFEAVEQVEDSIIKGVKLQIILDDGSKVPDDNAAIDALVKTIKAKNPQAEPLATMHFKTGVLLRIGEEIDHCKNQISAINQRIAKMKSPTKDELNKAARQIELLHLRMGSLALLRERFFDEGYISQGAFTKVCFVEEGQFHKSKVQEFRNTMQKSRKENVPLHEMIHRGESKKFLLGEQQKIKSNNQQNMISALENLAMYKGHFAHAMEHHPKNLKSYQSALIAQSKYSERILGAALSVVKEMKKEANYDPHSAKGQKIQDLEVKLQSAYFKAAELEMTKRKTQLNITTSKKLLMEAILKKDPTQSREKVGKALDDILNRQEPGNPLYDLRFEETLLPEDIYLSQISAMAQMGLVTLTDRTDAHGNILTDNPEINAILHARCGLVAKDQHTLSLVKQVHHDSEQLTLIQCGFNTPEDILDFNREVEELTMNAYSLSVSEGVVQAPSQEQDPSTSILPLWKTIANPPKP